MLKTGNKTVNEEGLREIQITLKWSVAFILFSVSITFHFKSSHLDSDLLKTEPNTQFLPYSFVNWGQDLSLLISVSKQTL